MQSIYIKYLNKTNKTNKKRDEIHICTLELEQELYISNEKKEKTISPLEKQTVKVIYYKKMIEVLQSLAFAEPDKL